MLGRPDARRVSGVLLETETMQKKQITPTTVSTTDLKEDDVLLLSYTHETDTHTERRVACVQLTDDADTTFTVEDEDGHITASPRIPVAVICGPEEWGRRPILDPTRDELITPSGDLIRVRVVGLASNRNVAMAKTRQ